MAPKLLCPKVKRLSRTCSKKQRCHLKARLPADVVLTYLRPTHGGTCRVIAIPHMKYTKCSRDRPRHTPRYGNV